MDENEIREKIGKGKPEHINRIWLGEVHSRKGEGGIIYVKNDFVKKKVLYHYGGGLNGYDIQIDESFKPTQVRLDLEVLPVDYSAKKREEKFKLCLPYSYVNSSFGEDPYAVIHEGNRDVYNHFGNLLRAMSGGRDNGEGSCSVLYGRNGLGKTFASDDLAYMLRAQKIPAVAFGLDELVGDLNPKNLKYDLKAGEIPKYYQLAKDAAEVVIIDQAHELMYRNNGKKWHRAGTQNWVFDLVQSVRKRGGHVLFSITETPDFELEDLVEYLEDTENKDKHGNSGNRDLGSRVDSYPRFKMDNISVDEQEGFIRDLVEKSEILAKADISQDALVAGFVAAGYGLNLNPRKISSNICQIEEMVEFGYEINPAYVVDTVGKRRARKRLREGGFDFGSEEKNVSEMGLDVLFSSLDYDGKDIIAAIEHYDDSDFRLRPRRFDKEIRAMIDSVYAYVENDCKGRCDYKVSNISRNAMNALMLAWKNRQGNLF